MGWLKRSRRPPSRLLKDGAVRSGAATQP